MENYKTIREIADEIGIDKQKVYRFIKKNKIAESYNKKRDDAHKSLPTMYFDEATQILIKHHFIGDFEDENIDIDFDLSDSINLDNESVCHSSNDIFFSLVEALKSELDIKNKQIESLTNALSESTKLANSFKIIENKEDQEIVLDDSRVPEKKPNFFSYVADYFRK